MVKKLKSRRTLSWGISLSMNYTTWGILKRGSWAKIAALYGISQPGAMMITNPRKAGTLETIRKSSRRKLQRCWIFFKGNRPILPDPKTNGDGVQDPGNTQQLLFWRCLGSLLIQPRGKLSGISLQFPKLIFLYGLYSITALWPVTISRGKTGKGLHTAPCAIMLKKRLSISLSATSSPKRYAGLW